MLEHQGADAHQVRHVRHPRALAQLFPVVPRRVQQRLVEALAQRSRAHLGAGFEGRGHGVAPSHRSVKTAATIESTSACTAMCRDAFSIATYSVYGLSSLAFGSGSGSHYRTTSTSSRPGLRLTVAQFP